LILKIGVCGTSHAGKTTFIGDIAEQLEEKGHKTIIIDEIVRSCPLPINEEAFLSSQLHIALSQITKEIEAGFNRENNGCAVLITDRTILDNYAYALSFEIRKRKHFTGTQIMKNLIGYWVHTYNIVFYLKPLPTPIENDGVRSTDPIWQREIDRIISSTIQHYRLNNGVVHTIHTTNREGRVEEALLYLTPLLQQKNKNVERKSDYTVQEQIPVQEVFL